MTTGAVIFAHNNTNIDYTKLAVFAASRIKKYLDIPVSLVTDNKDWLEENYPDHGFDSIIEIPAINSAQRKNFYDGSITSKPLEWKNSSRSQIYNLTPYDRTLVIDSDYIINSSILKSALDNTYDFQIYKNSFDLAVDRDSEEFKRINQYSIPFYWATVFIFQKNTITQSFFDLVFYIKSNWAYFRLLYNIDSPIYRNDFAFSIAIHIMNGKTDGEFATELPGTMTYCTDTDVLVEIKEDKVKVLTQKKNFLGEYVLAKTSGLDVHVMNKMSLSRFIDGGSGV
jgi:hypothetical protein